MCNVLTSRSGTKKHYRNILLKVAVTRLETSWAKIRLSLQSLSEEFKLYVVSIRQLLKRHPYKGVMEYSKMIDMA